MGIDEERAPATSSPDAPRPENATSGRGWDIATVAGALGVVVYGALFNAYRAYYEPLNLSPEDVGITSVFVLVRSIGFVVLILVAAVPLLLAFALLNAWEQQRGVPAGGVSAALRRYTRYNDRTLWRAYGVALAAAVYFTAYVIVFFDGQARGGPIILAAIVLAVGLVLLAVMRWSAILGAFQWLIAFAIVLITAAVLPLVLTISKAGDLGVAARDGQPVESLDVLGFPVLDVTAPQVRILWSDPRTPHPAGVFGRRASSDPADGILVGQTDNAVYVSVAGDDGRKVVRVDPRQVIIEFRSKR